MKNEELDVRGLKCPMPILRAKKALAQLNTGDTLTVYATDAGAPDDFAAFCRHTGHELLLNIVENDVFKICVKHR